MGLCFDDEEEGRLDRWGVPTELVLDLVMQSNTFLDVCPCRDEQDPIIRAALDPTECACWPLRRAVVRIQAWARLALQRDSGTSE